MEVMAYAADCAFLKNGGGNSRKPPHCATLWHEWRDSGSAGRNWVERVDGTSEHLAQPIFVT